MLYYVLLRTGADWCVQSDVTPDSRLLGPGAVRVLRRRQPGLRAADQILDHHVQ